MTLADGTIGNMYTVVDIQTDTNIERRLEALGLIRGTKIQLLGRKRSGTSIFYVRGTRLAVGQKIACGIEVTGGDDHE